MKSVFQRKYLTILVLAACCSACNLAKSSPNGFKLPVPTTSNVQEPKIIQPNQPTERESLIDDMSSNRVLFIGEIHDHIEHHQNQLSLIQSLYERFPDFAIGVEYFQQPFQSYLDDYIAGRIDEKEMLIKTEYYKRWKIDYRLLQPIFQFAREKHIPILALNVAEEIHNKVFKGGIQSLNAQELLQIPDTIKPANENYRQRLKSIFDTHPQADSLEHFVDGVLLWDEGMAATTVKYLTDHPQSRVVVLAGLVHILYGDGIPERVNNRLGKNQSLIAVNGADFAQFSNIADYVLTTEVATPIPNTGKLGISLIDDQTSMHVSDFTTESPAKIAGLHIGDRLVSLDRIKVSNIAELKSIMFDKRPNDRVQVAVQRKNSLGISTELLFDITLN